MGHFDQDFNELEGEYPLNFGSEIYALDEVSPEATESARSPQPVEQKRRRLIAPERSLQLKRPDLAAELHPVRNGDLDPMALSAGTRQKVWWMCENGHEWKASVAGRTRGTGCPRCARRWVPAERSVKARHPGLAAELHPSRNAGLDPATLGCESNRLVWWRCARGHEWEARVFARSKGSGCPVCSRALVPFERSLAYKHPALAAQLHPSRNGELDAAELAAGSSRKVWWRCTRGHVWEAAVFSRAAGSGCPKCNRLRRARGSRRRATT